PIVVSRPSRSGKKSWSVNVGAYNTRTGAERMLLKTALKETATLDGSSRRVVKNSKGFNANFVGLTQETAQLACKRLNARGVDCRPIGPS
ncbi:MAG: SPOR domain-containing protein, partial [Halocynthiibacter sp.]